LPVFQHRGGINVNRQTVTVSCATVSALFLLVIGIIHSIVNVSGLRRALARGEIAARLGDAVLFNAAYSGLFMSLFGLIVLLLLPQLRSGNNQACRVVAAIGLLMGSIGVAGFILVPSKPLVLIFLLLSLPLLLPILIRRRIEIG
jgi:hypothetical protein